MSKYLLKLGKSGEELVCQELKGKGYEIIAANENTKFGEIDVIAKKSNHILFVEVKTRSSFKFGRGDESVNYFKKSHFVKSVQFWIGKNDWRNEIRLKVATVHISKNNKPKISWFRMI